MITFVELTMRNFLSYGNNISTIKLELDSPTLIVGRNYDSIVNGQVDSNGSGKSAILNAIVFCLYDKTISNIEKADIVNYINNKNMEVSLVFIKNSIHYKVRRYRKNKELGGDGVRLFINQTAPIFDSTCDKTPDSVANANNEIARILGVPFDIFSRIVVFSASYEPFLSLPSSHASKANRRDIIEELFGLTELTRKAELLKNVISTTKMDAKALAETNNRIIEERTRFNDQIVSAQNKSDAYEASRSSAITNIKAELDRLAAIDTNTILNIINTIQEVDERISATRVMHQRAIEDRAHALSNNIKSIAWDTDQGNKLQKLRAKLVELSEIDVDFFEATTKRLDELTLERKKTNVLLTEAVSHLHQLDKRSKSLDLDLSHLRSGKCPYCNQLFSENVKKIEENETVLAELNASIADTNTSIREYTNAIAAIDVELIPLQQIEIPCDIKHIRTDIANIISTIESIENTVNPLVILDTEEFTELIRKCEREIAELTEIANCNKQKLAELSAKYERGDLWTVGAIGGIEARIAVLHERLSQLIAEENPFTGILEELQHTLNVKIATADVGRLDKMLDDLDHQEFLLKLLTKKDSFVRKALLNKNIPFLNTRIAFYLKLIGLSHTVVFTEEMTAKITQFNTEYSFANLSAGQKARINLALAFAFRDILQARFEKINLCILDECLDVGLGNVGVQLAAKMIKDIAKADSLSMFVVSHRDEIVSMFDAQLEIELRNGFSAIANSPVFELGAE